MINDRELAGMDAEALRGYVGVLHEALTMQARAGAQAMQMVDRSRSMGRQVSRTSEDSPMMVQLAHALAGNTR